MPYVAQTTQPTEGSRAFLQRRVGLFGLFAGGLGAAFLLWRIIELVVTDKIGFILRPDVYWHGVAAGCLLAVWLLVSVGRPTVRTIHVIETVGLLSSSVGYMAMASFIPPVNRPEFILILALNAGLVARAIYVPSSAKRTAILGGAVGVALVVGVYRTYLGVDPEVFRPLDPGMVDVTSATVARIMALGTLSWWAVTIALTTAASRVIYGLRREARKARQLGQYTLLHKIGEGGMGAVYRASHAMLRRPTAVKLLPPEKAGETALVRFEKEVQLTASLTHPNTVTIFDYGRTPDGVFYYAMELLDGPTLGDVVAMDGPQPAGRVVRILAQAAGALAEAHGVGLIHRDIKPANIMLVEQGGVPDVVKVVDFGLVKELSRDTTASLTNADAITGTPQYMAPEAILSPDEVDARSDLYALGAVAFFLLTGEHLFAGATAVEVCSHHLHTPPDRPSERLGEPLPPSLEDLVLRCLAKKPEERPGSAAALRQALLACDGVAPWEEEHARAWWQAHGAEARRSMRPSEDLGVLRTIPVDMVRRPGASSGED